MGSSSPAKDEVAPCGRISASRYAVFFGLAIAGLIADLWTKRWIFGQLWPPSPFKQRYIWLWEGHVGLEVSLNEGALFGIGQGFVPMFVVLSVLAALGVVYWLFVVGEARDLWLTIALGCVMAGIFGNLYDRLGLHGLTWPQNVLGHEAGEPVYAVRDWILVQWDDARRWPNFNLADSFLVCGAIMLFAHAFFPQYFGGQGAAAEASAAKK